MILVVAFIIQCDAKTVKQLNVKKPISFNERGNFGAAGFGGTWISPNEFTYSNGGNLTSFYMNTKSSKVLLESSFAVSYSNIKYFMNKFLFYLKIPAKMVWSFT